ncbi:MAG: hypothetical protein AAFU57_04745 [Bacteroidota bacterium]
MKAYKSSTITIAADKKEIEKMFIEEAFFLSWLTVAVIMASVSFISYF